MRFRRFSALGAPLDASEALADPAAQDQQLPEDIVANGQGEFLILWYESAGCLSGCPNEQAYGRLFDKEGVARSSPFRIAASTAGWSAGTSALALPAGDFLVASSEGPGPSATPPVDLYLALIPR